MDSNKPAHRWRRSAGILLVGAMVLAGAIAVVDTGLSTIDGTTPAALAQVATLGTPPPGAEASGAPSQKLTAADAMVAFAACMRDNGVEVDDPRFDINGDLVGGLEFGKDEGDESLDVALKACNDFLIAFKPSLDPALQAEQTESALRFAVCMRGQGLDWPDPAPDGSKFTGSEVNIDKKSLEFSAAFEVCDDELAVDGAGAGK